MELFCDKDLFNVLIFEHACKYNMKRVIKNCLQNEELLFQNVMDIFEGKINMKFLEKPKIQPIFFFKYLLKELIVSLDQSIIKDNEYKLLWNPKLLSLIIQLLETIYVQFKFTEYKCFFQLISKLKLMELLRLLIENFPNSDVHQKLNKYFPHWKPSYEEYLIARYNIQEPRLIEKVKKCHRECRLKILQLIVNHEKKKVYISQTCQDDLSKIIYDSLYYLNQLYETLNNSGQLSLIEKLIENLDASLTKDEPILDLFLEYAYPNLTEENLIKLSYAFDKFTESQQDIGFLSCFDKFAESQQDIGFLSCFDKFNDTDSEGSPTQNIPFGKDDLEDETDSCFEEDKVEVYRESHDFSPFAIDLEDKEVVENPNDMSLMMEQQEFRNSANKNFPQTPKNKRCFVKLNMSDIIFHQGETYQLYS